MFSNMTASASKYIYLEENVFESWELYKQQAGFAENTDSEFAELLLQTRLVSISYCSHVKTGQINIVINSEIHNITNFCL